MPRIFISYGITKSASTFAWQLIKRTAIAGGLPVATLTVRSKRRHTPEDYIDPVSEENLRLVAEDVGDAPVVIKTHGDATPVAVRLVAEGTAQVFASYRDLRDVALSLLDHGAYSRAIGIKDFIEFREVIDTIDSIRVQVKRFENWVKLGDPLLIPYDEICFETETTVRRVAARLGVAVDAGAIVEEFRSGKQRIGQFNRGQPRRFEREMDPVLSARFLSQFADYYDRYFAGELARCEALPMQDASETTRQPARNPAGKAQPASPSPSLVDELVTGSYLGVLGRRPDRSGLEAHSKLFAGRSITSGLQLTIGRLLGSEEYARKAEHARQAAKSAVSPQH